MQFNKAGLNRFMNEYIPMLVNVKNQRDQARMWLENQLKEYEAYGQEQRKTLAQSAINNIYETIAGLTKEQFKDRPAGELSALDYLKAVLPPKLTGDINIPAGSQQTQEELNQALINMAQSLQLDQNFTPEQLQVITSRMPVKYPLEMIQELLKGRTAKAEQALRTRGMDIEVEKMPLTKRELELRGQELEVERGKQKGDKTKAALLKDLEEEIKARDAETLKMAGVGGGLLGMFFEPTEKGVAPYVAMIRKRNERIADLSKKLGQPAPLPSEQDYKALTQAVVGFKASGEKINWHKMILDGFDPQWVLILKKKIEAMKIQ
jgi:hypothetical protein